MGRCVGMKKWNLFTEYDFLWAKYGLTMKGPEWEYFQGPGEVETNEQHFAFHKLIERRVNFRPRKGISLQIVGYANEFGSGGIVYNDKGEIGDYILTSDIEKVIFKEDGPHIITKSGSDYLLDGVPKTHMYEQMFHFKNIYLPEIEINRMIGKYFEIFE